MAVAESVADTAGADRLSFLVVWGVWATMTAALFGFVAEFGRNVPFSDDWELVPVLSGERSVDAAWLWEPLNEHRMPLPKLVLFALAATTKADFRAGMYFTCGALAVLAAGMIVVARHWRGSSRLTDAFFPLALLHWGQHQTLLWNMAVNFSCTALLAGTILLILGSIRGRLSNKQAALLGGTLLGLSLCGATGFLLVPPLALGMIVAGWRRLRSGTPGASGQGLLFLGPAVASLILVVVFLSALPRVERHTPSPDVSATVRTTIQFLGLSLGPASDFVWPLLAIAVIVVVAVCALMTFRATRPGPALDERAAGLLLYLGSLGMLALGVGWGRGGTGGVTAQHGTRFVTLAALFLCWAYFAALNVRRTRLGRAVPWLLFVSMAALLPLNIQQGRRYGAGQAAGLGLVEVDVRAGVAPDQLAQRWSPSLSNDPSAASLLADRFEMLRRNGCGPYKSLAASAEGASP